MPAQRAYEYTLIEILVTRRHLGLPSINTAPPEDVNDGKAAHDRNAEGAEKEERGSGIRGPPPGASDPTGAQLPQRDRCIHEPWYASSHGNSSPELRRGVMAALLDMWVAVPYTADRWTVVLVLLSKEERLESTGSSRLATSH